MSLDKLRALDAAASPGPWKYGGDSSRFHCVLAGGVLNDWVLLTAERSWSHGEPDAQLAALSHLLLPAMEALADPESVARRAEVLHMLEEALK